MADLDTATTHRIRTLCQEGYDAYDKAAYREALRSFYQAWLTIPKPQSNFEAAGWVLSAIGDSYFRLELFDQAIESLESALHCPKALGNPFIHLRLGQCYLDIGTTDLARKQFQKTKDNGGHALIAQLEKRYQTLILESEPTDS